MIKFRMMTGQIIDIVCPADRTKTHVVFLPSWRFSCFVLGLSFLSFKHFGLEKRFYQDINKWSSKVDYHLFDWLLIFCCKLIKPYFLTTTSCNYTNTMTMTSLLYLNSILLPTTYAAIGYWLIRTHTSLVMLHANAQNEITWGNSIVQYSTVQ